MVPSGRLGKVGTESVVSCATMASRSHARKLSIQAFFGIAKVGCRLGEKGRCSWPCLLPPRQLRVGGRNERNAEVVAVPLSDSNRVSAGKKQTSNPAHFLHVRPSRSSLDNCFASFSSHTIQLTTAEENCSPIANTSPFKGLQ
jgi:hypothetical protein